jgi:hypothetical protein
MIKTIFQIILPAKIDNTLCGAKITFYVFALYALLSTVRSCIHLLSPDGGAGSIAGMDLSVAGAEGIIFAFALWGSSQLLFALVQLLVVVRYRSLRQLVGAMKPVAFAHTPPGAIGNQLFLPLAALMLAWSVWSAYRDKGAAQ